MQEDFQKTKEEHEKTPDSWMNVFVKYTKIPILATIFIFLIGILALYQVPKESAPQIDFGTIIINTAYPGASAVDADSLITQEIEQKIKDVDGINEISSTSSKGFSSIAVQLEPSADTNVVLNDIRSKVDQAKSSIPEDAEDPVIQSLTGGEEPIFVLKLVADVNDTELRDYAEELKDFLEFDTNVKEVNISGGAEREIIVDLDASRLLQFGINASEVSNAIRSSHRDSPIGDLEVSSTEYSLRVQGRHQDAEDIGKIVIKTLEKDGVFSPITIDQVAFVEERGEKTDSINRLIDVKNKVSARNSISLNVIKKDQIDIFQADPKLREKTASFISENYGESVSIYYTLELLKNVKDSYGNVINSAIISILMVIILLILFLRVKESLVASLIIPLAFLMTIIITFLRGDTLNFMVNFSMVLSLGILVDVSIVIVEGIDEQLRKGKKPAQAALSALHEFRNPLLSGTLTTLAVFIPLFGLPDVLGKFLSFVPISVSITLTSALLIALLIIPGIASITLTYEKEKKKLNALDRFYLWRDIKINAISKAYQNTLKKFLSFRKYRIGGFYLIIILCFATFLLPVPFILFPSDDFDQMRVSVELSEGKVKEETLEATLPVEKMLSELPEVNLLATSINGSEATILVEFFEKDFREEAGMRTSLDIADLLREEFKKYNEYDVGIKEETFGPPSDAPVAFRVISQNTENLNSAQQVAEDFKAMLKEIPGTDNVRDNADIIPGEVVYQVNQEAILRFGVNANEAATTARAAVEGLTAATITRGTREVDVRVQYDQDQVNSFTDINRLQIINREGDAIFFSQLMEEDFGSGLSEIKRVDRQIAITVSADLSREGNAVEITQNFQEKAKDYNMPAGVSFEDAGETAENADLFFALGAGFIIALLMMFSILVIQFNSFSLPGVIVFTILMSLLGVNVGMWITGIPRSLAFIIGVISLAGIVVNDAIILVDRINTLVRANPHRDLGEMIAEAGFTRFQPIVLTTLTTAAGVFPLLFVDSFWAGLSVTIIFGLVVASTLTLFITPAMYYQIEKEMGASYLPLAILPFAGIAIGGLFSINITMILIGGIVTFFLGRHWWKKVGALRA
jgi:HAE1 family hydrophobic/amphiphilic exporter-1